MNPSWTTTYVPPANNAVTATQSPASAQMGTDKNASSGLNSILNLATQGAQIAGSIKYQRQQSGASARRQSLIAQCGRRPLFGRQAKADYDKCKADYQAGLLQVSTGGEGDVNKSMTQQSGSSMKMVWIGVGVLALGAIGYLAFRKK